MTAGRAAARPRSRSRSRVLVVGIYLADREHLAEEIVEELGRSEARAVEQRWVALGRAEIPRRLRDVTAWRSEAPVPKFTIVNRLLRGADRAGFDQIVVCDDDVGLPAGFLDRYLDLVERHDLALAQPARTHASYIDHHFVERLDGLDARRTRFVEIGPIFSMRRDAAALLAPFDEGSPMGWGYDFAWPVAMERAGLSMGIVDATPVAHELRKPVTHYSHAEADRAMAAYLARTPHLERADAFRILEAWS